MRPTSSFRNSRSSRANLTQNLFTSFATSSKQTRKRPVYSNLSDGGHGHLALVLSDAQYALLTDQPFVQPVHPGPLAISASTSNAMSTIMKEAHQEEVRIFREVQSVEKALIQQIVQAVAAPYLSSIRDRTSNSPRHSLRNHCTPPKRLWPCLATNARES